MIAVAPKPKRPRSPPQFGKPSRPPPIGSPKACAAFAAKKNIPPEYSDAETDDSHSRIGGDSIAPSECESEPTAVAAKHQLRVAPKLAFASFVFPRIRGKSSKFNQFPHVGNIGLFCGNWGKRGTVASGREKKARKQTLDRQIAKSPAQVLILCEATPSLEAVLSRPAEAGMFDIKDIESRLDMRCSYDHWVVRGNEDETAILFAARKNVTNGIELLEYDVNMDHPYKQDGKTKHARSRLAVCELNFKQNVGHLGTTFTVMGTHGHCRTMKFEWPKKLKEYWDKKAAFIMKYDVKFAAGDYNMCLTNVLNELRSRGIVCECSAWYPWIWDSPEQPEQVLGFDSCAIFYIGGVSEICMPWGVAQIDTLVAVVGTPEHAYLQEQLDVYEGSHCPGQHWSCYHSKKYQEKPEDKNLRDRLRDLLTPSSLILPPHIPGHPCPFLRLTQKKLDKDEWVVQFEHAETGEKNSNLHNGAHFPLCVFTKNARARSEVAQQKRNEKDNNFAWRKHKRSDDDQWLSSAVVAEPYSSVSWQGRMVCEWPKAEPPARWGQSAVAADRTTPAVPADEPKYVPTGHWAWASREVASQSATPSSASNSGWADHTGWIDYQQPRTHKITWTAWT